MKNKVLWLVTLLFLACSNDDNGIITDPPEEEETNLALVNAFPNLIFSRPVDIQSPNDDTNRLFVVEKMGRIKVFDNSSIATEFTFLDIESQVNASGELGLLGLAFHPNFESNGYFYVYYNPSEDASRISRFEVSQNNLNEADESSELILLDFFQDSVVHNGGQVAFGPDGYLYISSGDGGPNLNGQDTMTLTGNILRIDVDNTDPGLNYAIPVSNPFVSDSDVLDEIYAYGFRNPWRMSFDPVTGFLWAGDVGAGTKEEIDIVISGGNYGWSLYEGTNCRVQPCDPIGITMPFFEYNRPDDGASITGGHVYRGSANPELQNKYVYGDFVNGRIWAVDINSAENELLFDTDINISCFGVDNDRELYMADYFNGVILKFDQVEE